MAGMRSGQVIAAIALAAVASASGCASPAPHDPVPASAPGSVTDGPGRSLPYAGAPKVTHPLPASIMHRNPCTMLTRSQVDELIGTSAQGRWRDSGIAYLCNWSDIDRGSNIGVQLVYAAADGLSGAYAHRSNAAYFLELAPVHGYPLIAADGYDDRADGHCATVVGIADDLSLDIGAKLSEVNVGKADPCLAARRVADAVVATLLQS